MEEILAVVFGLGIVAASPFVPGLRPVAKKVIVAGLATGAAMTTVAAGANEHWKDLLAEAKAERTAEAEAKAAAPETITISASEA